MLLPYRALSSPIPKQRRVMVITFYKGQEHMIRDAFTAVGLILEEKPGDFAVMTVDQAQGSEYDIIILSCVRSNYNHIIGFVSNANRLNVVGSSASSKPTIN